MSGLVDLFGNPLDTLHPALKWAGGKRWLVPTVRPLWEACRSRRYVEPFCGGLGMALGLRPDDALLNDINAHVINFYRWCAQGLSTSVVTMENDEATYYSARQRFNTLRSNDGRRSAEAAALFYYLNRTCFNGLCRFGPHGFNVPFGKYKSIAYRADFNAYIPTFQPWTFTSTDFARVPLGADDFVYADPPYDVEFTKYAEKDFTWRDQVRTAEWLARHPGPVVLSNQATPRIVDLYTRLGFDLRFLEAPRRISCTGDRTPAREVLATRHLA